MKNYQKIISLICGALSIGLITGFCEEAGPNLLQNGDLEAGQEGTVPPGWTFSTWNLPSEGEETSKIEYGLFTDPEGVRSLRISNSGSSLTHVWWQQEVHAQGGATYSLRLRAKASKTQDGYASFLMGCYFYDAENHWVGYEKLQVIEFSDKWISYEGSVTVPDNVTRIGVRLSFQGKIPAEVLFSQVELVQKTGH